jgi:hypothetical protein
MRLYIALWTQQIQRCKHGTRRVQVNVTCLFHVTLTRPYQSTLVSYLFINHPRNHNKAHNLCSSNLNLTTKLEWLFEKVFLINFCKNIIKINLRLLVDIRS